MNQMLKNPPAPSQRIEQEREKRRRRDDMGLGRGRNLAIMGDLDPRYTYRWINDDPGRVFNLTKNDDWDLVTEGDLGERDAKDKGTGTTVERIVDKVTGKRAVLVRKLKDYYANDKQKEQAVIDDREAALKRGQSTSPEGLSGPSAYVPQGGIVITDGRRSGG